MSIRVIISIPVFAIDGLTTPIRGQKLPIFLETVSHDDKCWLHRSCVRLLGADSDENFAIVFAANGVKYDVAEFFRRTFEESGA